VLTAGGSPIAVAWRRAFAVPPTVGHVTNNGATTTLANIVLQAQGMVSVQADCALECALVRMQVRAHRMGLSLEEVAYAIVDRAIRLEAAS
jgi:hypothetical protein